MYILNKKGIQKNGKLEIEEKKIIIIEFNEELIKEVEKIIKEIELLKLLTKMRIQY